MTDLDDIKLDNYEDEDIFDVVVKLEKSFAIKFDKDSFINVKTFGDLCDVIESYIKYDNQEDCTKQQAFYKIRAAISETQLIDKKEINLDSNLANFFPRNNRRIKTKEFQNNLGIKLDILTCPDWITLTFVGGFLLSLVAFFFDWRVALSGITFSISGMKLAFFFGKELQFRTVRQLTEKVVTEHYINIRRRRGTVNRKEILETIKDAFSSNLSIDKEHLTPEAKLSWA